MARERRHAEVMVDVRAALAVQPITAAKHPPLAIGRGAICHPQPDATPARATNPASDPLASAAIAGAARLYHAG